MKTTRWLWRGVASTVASVFVMSAAASAGSSITADDAVLAPPTDSVVKPLASTQGCQILLDTGEGDCAVVDTGHGTLVFTVESGPTVEEVLVTRPWTVRVYAVIPSGGDTVALALTTPPAIDTDGALYADVVAVPGDVTGDGHPELVVGYRSEGTGQILDLDIVGLATDGDLTRADQVQVLAHLQLYKGVAKIKDGHLITWTPVYKKKDANCCPTWIRRDNVRYEDGVFVVTKGKKVRTPDARIPPGDF